MQRVWDAQEPLRWQNAARPLRYHQTVSYWILHWLVSGIALLIVAKILPGIQVDGLGPALIAALVIGLVSATVGLVLKIILLPFIVLTLGIVYFVINVRTRFPCRRMSVGRLRLHPINDRRLHSESYCWAVVLRTVPAPLSCCLPHTAQ